MPNEAIMQYFVSGQFWASMFLALLIAMFLGIDRLGTTSGNLRSQIPLHNWSQRMMFGLYFLVSAVVTNLVVAGIVAMSSGM